MAPLVVLFALRMAPDPLIGLALWFLRPAPAHVSELATSLARKATHALVSTKRHVNAVTAQMVGTMRSWADADGLVTAFGDAECAEARRDYLAARARGR